MSGWIGVDLDGTLAHYDGWQGIEHIGRPVELMMNRVKQWIADGWTVKIFTARAQSKEAVPYIEMWLKTHDLSGLEITNMKDMGMVELWDDRCVQVVPNTGMPIE